MALNLMNAQELMQANPFVPAVRMKTAIKLALVGMPGTGKTYTAMTLAKQWGLKTAVIDSERGSASKYADVFSFDVLTIDGDYHPTKYTNAIKAAEAHGYEVIIVDSLSHPWSGEGGMLQIVDRVKSGSKNKFAGWSEANPFHDGLIDAILDCKSHIIGTLRGKPMSDSGSNIDPIFDNLGVAPDQRNGFLHEFDIVGVMDAANICHISKSRVDTIQNLDLIVPDGLAQNAKPKQGRSVNYQQLAGQLLTWANKGIDPAKLFFGEAANIMTWVNALYAMHKTEGESLTDFGNRVRGYLNDAHNSGFDRLALFNTIYTEQEATEIVKAAIKESKVDANNPVDNPQPATDGNNALDTDPAAVDDDAIEPVIKNESPFKNRSGKAITGKLSESDTASESDASDSAAKK